MSDKNFADLLRFAWMPSLVLTRSSKHNHDFRTWLSDGEFQLYAPATNPVATLSFADSDPVCGAVASEISRMAMAAVESVASIGRVGNLPRAKAWASIQWYYASFYAAHALLRTWGTVLTQLETGHLSAVQRVAQLYSQPFSMAKGFYRIGVSESQRTATLSPMKASGAEGSHEFLWTVFTERMRELQTHMLTIHGSTPQLLELSNRIDGLVDVLTATGAASKGTWLSSVRNRICYRHELGSWFPYSEHQEADLAMFSDIGRPCEGADLIEIVPLSRGMPLVSFASACRFIVALSLDTANEMARRSSEKPHFHDHGVIHVSNLLRRPL